MPELKIGDKAPAFGLIAQDGKMVELADFKGKKLLLYFYPKADTPGCTQQACSVRDSTELTSAGVAAVGISPDQPEQQAKFDTRHGLGFPLLADQEHKVAEAYGVWGEKSMYGRKYMGIIRSVFLIDEKGEIAAAVYGVKPNDTVPRIMAALKN